MEFQEELYTQCENCDMVRTDEGDCLATQEQLKQCAEGTRGFFISEPAILDEMEEI